MNNDKSYKSLMARKNEIMKNSVGIDYLKFESGSIAFNYEKMMSEASYSLEEIINIQNDVAVGNTPIIELKNLTALARKLSPSEMGARIFIKDESCNPSGSFKARRAATAVYHAKKLGYKGVIAATSGNYGAAVASQAAKQGLKCIVVQECYDSNKQGQPEILEKQRACEALGAEVVQLTVGPELFYTFLCLLEETGYFNASLYTPFGIAGVESLGFEIAKGFKETYNSFPDKVIVTHAGGGNVTGTARGLLKADAKDTQIVASSVDLTGLHMASDEAFNKKSFTTGHTGFGIPFASMPDRSDVPRNAARPLRYMDRYVLVKQGEVFYITQALATLEGLERGPAGNTSLTAAFSLAQQMPQDQTILVQETEYTGAGKHPMAQLSFARKNGIEIFIGNPEEEIPGKSIILPDHPSKIQARDYDITKLRTSYIKNMLKTSDVNKITDEDIDFLAKDTKTSTELVNNIVSS